MKFTLAILLLTSACAARQNPAPPANAYDLILAKTAIDGRAIAQHVVGAEVTAALVFASWCHPCRRELAIMQTLQREQPRLRVVAINYYESWGQRSDDERLRAYLQKNAPELTVVRGDAALVESLGGVPKIPSLFLFDRRGQLIATFRRNERSPPEIDELRQAINAACGSVADFSRARGSCWALRGSRRRANSCTRNSC